MFEFVDAGITTFDCADIYTGVEALIGRFLGTLAQTRGRDAIDGVQVHTKYVPNRSTLATVSRADVARAIDRSLARLGVERLDLVQLHWWDFNVPRYVETARHLADLQRAGKIRHLAVTNVDTLRLREITDAGVGLVSHQVQYSVIDRRPAGHHAAFCRERGIAMLCYGTVAGGFVSPRYLGAPAPASPQRNRSLTKYALVIEEWGGWELFQELLTTLADIGGAHDVGPDAVAIAWALGQPGVAAAIVGATDPTRVDELVRAATLQLTSGEQDRIAAIQRRSHGPSGGIYELERIQDGRHAAIMRYELNKD
jgi:aryl-alcohol dehydrogenase-like predicted oxidoreductase